MKKVLCFLIVALLLCHGCSDTSEKVTINGQRDELKLLYLRMNDVPEYEIIEKGFVSSAKEKDVNFSTILYESVKFVKNQGILLNDISTQTDLIETLQDNSNSNTGIFCYGIDSKKYKEFLANSESLYAMVKVGDDDDNYCDLIVNSCSYEAIYTTAVEYILENHSKTEKIGFAATICQVPKEESHENNAINNSIDLLNLENYETIEPISWYGDEKSNKMISDLCEYISTYNIDVLIANYWIPSDVLEQIKSDFSNLKIIYLKTTKPGLETVDAGITEAVIGIDFYEMGYKTATEMIYVLKGEKQPEDINLEPFVISSKQQATEYLNKIS